MKFYKLNEIKNKRVLGRNVRDADKKDAVNLFWAASALEINVKSSEVWAEFQSDYRSNEPWASVFLNGARIARFMIEKDAPKKVCLARGLNPQNENVISVYKDTQPMPDDDLHSLKITKIAIDDDGIFCELKPTALKMEFIGDSITSGEGLAGFPNQQEWIPALFVGSESYAAQLARKFNADFSVFSQCGWGLCHSWDGNPNNNMPAHYEKICSVMKGEFQRDLGVFEYFDFKNGSDVVILNLGTNDESAFFQPAWKDEKTGAEYKLTLENGKPCKKDEDFIVNSAKNFLNLIRNHNKNAQIIWCYGMMKLKIFPDCLKKAVEQWISETGDKKIRVLELDSMEDLEKTEEDKGSRGHPGKKVHKFAAQKLEKAISELI